MAEYIEREALLKTHPFTKVGGNLTAYTEGYLDCVYEARESIKNAPTADVVSKSLYDQIKWERDTAISQLESYGVGLGEKADVVEVVRCKDCKHFEHNFENDTYCRCVGGLTDPENNDFCSYGERKDNEC